MLPLICIDVDGTLVGSSHEPTEAVWGAAHGAIDRGQHLAISTGRGAFGRALEYARMLDPNGWHIFHNGAALFHSGTDEVRPSELTDAVVTATSEIADRNGWVIEYYSALDYTVDSSHQLAVDHARLLGVPLVVRDRGQLSGAIVRMQLVVPTDELPRVKTEMAAVDVMLAPATSPGMPGVTFVSVMKPGVSKGSAIEAIAELLGLSVADVMMVGDGDNDLEALTTAGHGVAMANASPAARDAARHHVGHVDDDGLVDALELSTQL